MTETGLPEGLEQALHRLSAVLNNAALEWSDERSMEAVLVDYASERIAALEAENSFLQELLVQLDITDVNFRDRTFRVKADPKNWFGVKGTAG